MFFVFFQVASIRCCTLSCADVPDKAVTQCICLLIMVAESLRRLNPTVTYTQKTNSL